MYSNLIIQLPIRASIHQYPSICLINTTYIICIYWLHISSYIMYYIYIYYIII